jgi:hypothetical protein
MQPDAKCQVGSVRTKCDLKRTCNVPDGSMAVSCEPSHNHGVVFAWCRESGHCNVAVADGFDLEDLP